MDQHTGAELGNEAIPSVRIGKVDGVDFDEWFPEGVPTQHY